MKLALTLSTYISKQFLFFFAIVASVFSLLIMLIDAIEMLRRGSTRPIPIYILLDMVVLKLPVLLQVILPFIVLVASVLAYTTLARRSELVVIRSAGVSVWEFLAPSIITAFILGWLIILIVNPLSAVMTNKYEYLNAKYFENKQNLLDMSDTGLWFKQSFNILPAKDKAGDEDKYEMVIHALDVTGSDTIILKNLEMLAFDADDNFIFRIDAENAKLHDGKIDIETATVTNKDNTVFQTKSFAIETTLKQSDIEKSFNDPEAISIFHLPAFINKLKSSGFSALAHELQMHKILSSPFFFGAMVMIGAIFSLRSARQGMIGYSISLSIVFGFMIYFVSNIVSSIGLSGSMPVIVAAWTPVFITLLIGFGLLLHYEDG